MLDARRPALRRTAGRAARLAGAAALVGGVVLAAAPRPSAAQETGIRAVATFDPSDGSRSLELMRPLTPEEVAAVQRRLAERGHRSGEHDGSLDARTRRTLSAFQREEGLDPCGCVDVATVRRLDIALRVLVTRVASGGEERAGAGDPTAERGENAGVEVVYPTTTRPERPGPEASRGASSSGRPDRVRTPTPEAAVGTGFLWTFGTVVPVPVPVFVGGEGPFPGGKPGAHRPADAGTRGGMRPTPFRRVPFPGSRPSPSTGGNP